MKSHTANDERIHRKVFGSLIDKHVIPAIAGAVGRVAGSAVGKAATSGAARSGLSPAASSAMGQAVGGVTGQAVTEKLEDRQGENNAADPAAREESGTTLSPPPARGAGGAGPTFKGLSAMTRGVQALNKVVQQSYTDSELLRSLDELEKNMGRFRVHVKDEQGETKGDYDLPGVGPEASGQVLSTALHGAAGFHGAPWLATKTKKLGGKTFVRAEKNPGGQGNIREMSSFQHLGPDKGEEKEKSQEEEEAEKHTDPWGQFERVYGPDETKRVGKGKRRPKMAKEQVQETPDTTPAKKKEKVEKHDCDEKTDKKKRKEGLVAQLAEQDAIIERFGSKPHPGGTSLKTRAERLKQLKERGDRRVGEYRRDGL
jgi:hypothetical protein